MAVHAYTSLTFSYLDRARVLAKTLRRHHPDWVIWVILTDKPPAGYDVDWSAAGYDHVLTADALFGKDTARFLFGHDLVEACTAVKGKALQRIMEDPSAEKIVYLDPDIAVFNPLTPVVDALDDSAIVLTPHQLEPEPAVERQAIIDNEIASLQYGVFNLGFIAVRNDAEGRRFAGWWSERLHDWCHDRLDLGLFTDQKWCNLIPCFFDRVTIMRDPGLNVASWNLSRRTVSFDAAGGAQVNGVPLRFFHFTKFGPIGAAMTERYAGDNADVFELWWWYGRALELAADPHLPAGWWHYGVFDNGVPITMSMRELYRGRDDLQKAFPKPFTTGGESFFEWLSQHGHR